MTTTTTPELTPDMLRIPAALAQKYATPGKRHGVSHDELLSAAHLAFAQALVNWREERSPGGAEQLAAYLVVRVRWAVKNAIWIEDRHQPGERFWRRTRRRSMDAPLSPDTRATFHQSHGRADRSLLALEEAEEAERLLACLPERERLAVRMLAEGKRQIDVAKALGLLSRESVRQIVERAGRRLTEQRRESAS